MKKALIDHWKLANIIRDNNVLRAFEQTRREDFVPTGLKKEAYTDMPLPIYEGQTISQPTTVMLMLQALELKKDDVVLEIGAGSGYNAALISKIAKKVYTTEIMPKLAEFARQNIKKAGIKNIVVIETDGSKGYPPGAPYDKIVVTAACPRIPSPLIKQLKEEGIILAPVGSDYNQTMIKAIKIKGRLIEEDLGMFMFVPLRGEFGFG